jgi:hypothetical protein
MSTIDSGKQTVHIIIFLVYLTLLLVTELQCFERYMIANISFVIPFFLQPVLVNTAICVKTFTKACRRALSNAPV